MLSVTDNIGMQNYKVVIGYSSAPGSYSSKSRFVLADTQANAIKQALSLMKLPAPVSVLRVDIH